jgi:hypothetical protein
MTAEAAADRVRRKLARLREKPVTPGWVYDLADALRNAFASDPHKERR